MRRLLVFDKALLSILVPLWGLCFVLYLDDLARGRLAWVPVAVTLEAESGYPAVRGTTGLGRGWDAGDVRIGDRLLRVGDADLRGVGQIGFVARVYAAADPGLRVRVGLVREGKPIETWLILRPLGFAWRFSVVTLPFVVMAVLIMLRLPGSPLARAAFLASMAHAFHWTPFYGGRPPQTYAALAVFALSACFGWPLLLRLAWNFPEPSAGSRFREPPAWIWVFALGGPVITGWFFGVPWVPGVGPAFYGVGAAFSASCVALATRAYLRADPIGRRQLKWVLYGMYVGFGPVLATTALGLLGLASWRAQEMATIAVALVPVCGFVAIVRFDLLDIDRLISTTATYSVLSTLLLAAALLLVPRLSEAITVAGRVEPVVGQTVLAVLLACLVLPAQRYIGPQVERIFFAERHALQRGGERLLHDLSTCDAPDTLLQLAGERLGTLIRPECCVVYGRAADTYVPIFVRGRVVPPPFGADSGIVQALEAMDAPLEVAPWRRRHGARLRPTDSAALDSLGATILVPMGRRGMLTAFLCLGEKHSGDVYTATDRVLLAALGQKVASELDRFDVAVINRQARAMQEALRRYVPAPVAARLDSGEDLDMGEREISVLFVDLRGYTTYSEGRTATEIFSTINRYTERVSDVIRAHGGTVVEFNGDGMMAVFGAPESIAHKERAAVEAGCALITTVRSLDVGDARPFDVGVGIATGKAFVGNIRSADRWIWSAIGNTTNLAARLQALTRELGAAVALDTATWRAAGSVAETFERHREVAIRGCRRTEDVYVLPLGRNA